MIFFLKFSKLRILIALIFCQKSSINALAFTAEACGALTSASDAIADILLDNKGYITVYNALIVAHDAYASANTFSAIEAAYPAFYAVQQAFENVETVDIDQENNESVIHNPTSAPFATSVDKAVGAAFVNLIESYVKLQKAKNKKKQNDNLQSKIQYKLARGAFIIARQNAYDEAKKNPLSYHDGDKISLLAKAVVLYKDAKKPGVKDLTELKSKLEQALLDASKSVS